MAGLSDKQRAFIAAYLGPARFSATKAARIAGYAHPDVQGPRLLGNVGVAAAIQAWRDEAKGAAITDVDYRVSILDDLERRYRDLIAARAIEHAGVVGGETGLLVKQVKFGGGGIEIREYAADTAVTKEIRELHKQAATELGQWTEHHRHEGVITFADLAAIAEADAEPGAVDSPEGG